MSLKAATEATLRAKAHNLLGSSMVVILRGFGASLDCKVLEMDMGGRAGRLSGDGRGSAEQIAGRWMRM